MAGGETREGSLEATPTWAVATVTFVLVATSLLIEFGLHLSARYFNKKRKKSLNKVFAKIKSELMLLGFISLALTIIESSIAKICISKSVGEIFLPCKNVEVDQAEESKCTEQDMISLMSRAGVRQLQLFFFVLAFFHVFTCFLTFSLGMAKMKRWKSWEAKTRTLEYEFSNDPRRVQLIHQTSFGKRHLKFWSEHRYLRLPVCFLRQFYKSVSEVDYLALRHGFIAAHFTEGNSFDFQKYLKRALEKDFEVIVGIRYWIWVFSVVFIFLNARAFYSYFWLPFIPLVMLLIVGTKLQDIITRMCLDTFEKSHVVRGTLLVRPSDHFFWFGRPKLLLNLMNFILFQNSFQLAFFTWTWFNFGLRSCYHQKIEDIVIKLVMGPLVHILCGYVTLPLYALVTQMGTSMRTSVFPEGVVSGLNRWRAQAKKNLAKRSTNSLSRPSLDASITSLDTSPSFSTINASFVPHDNMSSRDVGFVTVEVGDEDNVEGIEKHKKLGSFEGFDINKTS